MDLRIPRLRLIVSVLLLGPTGAQAAEVSGRVAMPEVCAPAISPAVVLLEPRDRSTQITKSPPADVTLVRQVGLIFVPRVQVARLGQTVTITNEDAETHSVHNVGAGANFSYSMAPGQAISVPVDTEGVIKLVCDVHSHMRGYLIVSRSPWVAVCGADGQFRIDDVPDGPYVLRVWHELGDPLRKDVTIAGQFVDLGVLTVTGPAFSPVSLAAGRAKPWSEVIDGISVTLSASLAEAQRTGGITKARRLADDAYFAEFEASQMETAVRRYLGFSPAGELESQFRAMRTEVRNVAEGKHTPAQAGDRVRQLLAALLQASGELNRQGITDASHIGRMEAGDAGTRSQAVSSSERSIMLAALSRAFEPVRALADRGDPEEAASAMADAYFAAFEPLETELQARGSWVVPRLEARYNALRGEVSAGLNGPKLAEALNGFQSDVAATLDRSGSAPLGAFGAALGVSFLTIVREGLEVILLLTMLFALVAKTGQPRYRAALWWGIGAAVVGSLSTAFALNRMMASARGRQREMLEGMVMLAAAGVLFYVSYWLISRSEAKRWAEFLKRQMRQGAELGQLGTLGLTAFLAVYREGAETALMYQALLDAQSTRLGELGLAAGLGLGLFVLAGVFVAIRYASVRLPMQAFFKLSGLLLFAMAVAFAGKAVFELQNSGLIRVTALPWLGSGLPFVGFYPNLQVVLVQAILLAGAPLALLVFTVAERWPTAGTHADSGHGVMASSNARAGA
jgi:high-affinity iron transporter